MQKPSGLLASVIGLAGTILLSPMGAVASESVVCIPFRDVRAEQDFSEHGWILSRYLEISLTLLGKLPGHILVEDCTPALERAGSLNRTRIEADEARRIARELGADHVFWGSFSKYESGQVIGLLYLNTRSGKSAEVSASDRPENALPHMNRLILELCRKLVWGLPDRPEDVLTKNTPRSLAAFSAFTRGEAAWRRKAYDDSERFFSEAVVEDPEFTAARFFLANSLMKNEKNGEARDLLRAILETSPAFRPAGNNLGVLLLNEGKVPEAWRVLNRTARVAGASAILEFNLGLAQLERGNDFEGQAHLEKAIELAPDFAAAHYQMAVFFASRDNSGPALRSFERARELDRTFELKLFQQAVRVAPIPILDLNETIYDIRFLPPSARR